MNLHLVDHNQDVIDAWKTAFSEHPKVDIQLANMMEVATCCVVSPANSYGFMDGGIDKMYRDYFGDQLESEIQQLISQRPEGYLPIGTAVTLHTRSSKVPYIIVAPTMITPEMTEIHNAERAFRAILREAAKHPNQIKDIYCPGLATGVGQADPVQVANRMASVWSSYIINE
ncbi:MAG: macro domain-containing protein [Balneola sp.]